MKIEEQTKSEQAFTEALPPRHLISFPGPLVGGVSLILAPLLLLAGVLARIQFHFFFPDQLAGYEKSPKLIFTAYSLF